MFKNINQSPTITDNVLLTFTTTDYNGNTADPYIFNSVIIYFLSRDYSSSNLNELNTIISGTQIATTSYFNNAIVVAQFGNNDYPAWLSSDTPDALIERTGVGEFQVIWSPEKNLVREGDYICCFTWMPIIAGDILSNYFPFYLSSSSIANNLPIYQTDPTKYPTLLDRYTPEYLKLSLSSNDLTSQVINSTNLAVADGFVVLEDLANQVVGLQDANILQSGLLVYLANFFNLKLRTNNSALWRRQIKNAIPLFKQKGTVAGLTTALAQANITLNSLTRLWQVVSPYTRTESFTYSGNDVFDLIGSPSDTMDFQIFLRPHGSETYTNLTTYYADISYNNSLSLYQLTWTGNILGSGAIGLSDGDIIKIIYNIAPIVNSEIEDTIQGLPLADQRDEATVSYPPKNWNVHLIEETDPMFGIICPSLNPFAQPIVYGQIRTEFPYSENVYNADTYDGGLYDSNDPCFLDKNFLDYCSCCISSQFNIDIEIERLSNARLTEALDIIEEWIPFHASINAINFQGSITETVPPQIEHFEVLIDFHFNDFITEGQAIFNRSMLDINQVHRDVLATANTVVSNDTGTGYNISYNLSSAGVRFDGYILPLNPSSNVLEILTGANAGQYTVSNPSSLDVVVNQSSPDSLSFPLNTSNFAFQLSNVMFDGTVDNITQDNIYTFTDVNNSFRFLGVQSGYKIGVSSPSPLIGTYTISYTYPDDSLILNAWANNSNASNITYQVYDNDDNPIGSPSTTGNITVALQGLVNFGIVLPNISLLEYNNYFVYDSQQYLITSFPSDETCTISNYNGGNVGVSSAAIYRQLLNTTGSVGYYGMILETTTNYESDLQITNGANNLFTPLENSQFKENFLVLIGSSYYTISQIDGETITLIGPTLQWGLSGTSVEFSIIQFVKNPINIEGTQFSCIDRRNNDIIQITTQTEGSMTMTASLLNSVDKNGFFETVPQQENFQIIIEDVE